MTGTVDGVNIGRAFFALRGIYRLNVTIRGAAFTAPFPATWTSCPHYYGLIAFGICQWR